MMNFRVGQVFENVHNRRTIIDIKDDKLITLEGEKVGRMKKAEYSSDFFARLLRDHNYLEIPQKSNNFKLIYDILNGDTDTNTPGHSAS